MRTSIAVAGALALALLAADPRAEERAATEVKAGDIAKNPATYMGTRVRVKAEVEDVYGAHAFTLDEDRMLAGPDVLVLVPAPLKPVPEGDDVTVSGPVHEFVRARLERDYQWFSPNDFGDPDVLVRFESRPVIVAESIRTDDGVELAGRPERERAGERGTRHGDAPER